MPYVVQIYRNPYNIPQNCTYREVEVVSISGHDIRLLQNASGGLSNGVGAAGCTGESLCCRNDPCRAGIIDSVTKPRADDRLRLVGICPTLADGDGTFQSHT